MRYALAIGMAVLATASACSRKSPLQPAQHSRATLILEHAVVQPGEQTRIGIQFEMDKNWHIYWRNPGDSGEAPRIRWELPQGIEAGPLEWPSPSRLETSAGVDYAYEGRVVLLSTVRIPAAASPGGTMQIAGALRWLVCSDVCIPQAAEVKMPVRVATAAIADGRAEQLLKAAAGRLPQPLPAELHASAVSSPESFDVIFASKRVAHAEFFPAEPEQIDNAAPQTLINHNGSSQLQLKKSDHLQTDPERLTGVLVLDGRAYQIDLPVHASVAYQRRPS
jgi:DsbC/DsbD-like thiol-disulfide interchange protein